MCNYAWDSLVARPTLNKEVVLPTTDRGQIPSAAAPTRGLGNGIPLQGCGRPRR